MTPHRPAPTAAEMTNGTAVGSQTNGTMAKKPTAAASSATAKSKKTVDPAETKKLLAAKISQLESDKAGELEEEAEIGMSSTEYCKIPASCSLALQSCRWPPLLT